MTPTNFVYWLQGMFEISEAGGIEVESLDKSQLDMIKKHLGYVFSHMEKQPEPEQAGSRHPLSPLAEHFIELTKSRGGDGTVIC
jgi:hypothetical protein